MKINCRVCNKEFSIPPERLSTAKYCSRACMGKDYGESKTGKAMPQETKERLKAALKEKWASGTRKRNPEESWDRARDTRVKNFPNGTYTPTLEAALKGLAARDPVKLRERCKALGKSKAGKPNPPGRSEAGPENWKAKFWALKAPNGQTIKGKNLNDLIRENEHLFNKDDVKWVGSRCRASKGLANLFLTKSDGKTPCARSWKGWTPILKSEDTEKTPHHGSKVVTLPPIAR
jgi:hypothetical protein